MSFQMNASASKESRERSLNSAKKAVLCGGSKLVKIEAGLTQNCLESDF